VLVLSPEQLVQSAAIANNVLAAMITPALLFSACGTFIISTANRLGRVFDRSRVVSQSMEQLILHEKEVELPAERQHSLLLQMRVLLQRAGLLQWTITTLYVASGLFILTSVFIGLLSLFTLRLFWIPVLFGILGAICLLGSCLLLIIEARLALRNLKEESDLMNRLVLHHADIGTRQRLES
jgi:hypothetical protein